MTLEDVYVLRGLVDGRDGCHFGHIGGGSKSPDELECGRVELQKKTGEEQDDWIVQRGLLTYPNSR
jgi:hypothetical protein